MKQRHFLLRSRATVLSSLGLLALLGAGACGNRPDSWETDFSATYLEPLQGSVALFDSKAERVLFVTAPGPKQVEVKGFASGHDVRAFVASKDRSQLFVLSAGEVPRLEPDDEKPRLQVFTGGPQAKKPVTYELDDPMGSLALDPEGEWVAAFAGSATVTNPNEIVLLDLKNPKAKPVSKTLRSYGGSPVELVFTKSLAVPEGPARRFLIARTDRDVTLVDLSDLTRDEITVKLPEDDNGVPRVPLQVVHDDGDSQSKTDARLGVRLAGTSDVMLLQLDEPTQEGRDFSVVVNIVDVGGIPSTLDFLRTDGGLRLAALVPDLHQATLVNPTTTLAEIVDLGGAYSSMTRITSALSDTPGQQDVALLWGQTNTFAFWSLGSTSGTPYRAVDSTELDVTLSAVLDVPEPNGHLKVLVGQDASQFFVLDLRERQSFPLRTDGTGYKIEISSDGERLWAFHPFFPNFSAVRFSDLHPSQLYVEPAPGYVFDLERADGGRAALVLSTEGGLRATLLDADAPDSAKTTYFPALDLEELP